MSNNYDHVVKGNYDYMVKEWSYIDHMVRGFIQKIRKMMSMVTVVNAHDYGDYGHKLRVTP